MNLIKAFKPKPTISEQEVKKGLRWLTYEGMASLGFNSITTSGFLAAFALLLGASNLQIGIVAAIPFLMHLFQIPASLIIERVKRRKLIAVFSWFLAQLVWVFIALIPVFTGVPSGFAISLLLILLIIRGLMHAFCNSSWNSWIRDLVPQNIFGRFFSRRLALAALVGVIFGVGSALFVDYWQRGHVLAADASMGYTYVLLFGAICLALALAFGLGGREKASEILNDLFKKKNE